MLKRFEEYKTCPVCNEPRFDLRNAKTVSRFPYRFHFNPVIDGKCMKIKDLNKDEEMVEIRVNHLHVSCIRCSYEWLERVALQGGDGDE